MRGKAWGARRLPRELPGCITRRLSIRRARRWRKFCRGDQAGWRGGPWGERVGLFARSGRERSGIILRPAEGVVAANGGWEAGDVHSAAEFAQTFERVGRCAAVGGAEGFVGKLVVPSLFVGERFLYVTGVMEKRRPFEAQGKQDRRTP